jgi:hypothetical protein
VILVADAHRDRARDPVDAEEKHVQGVTPLPPEPLLRVVVGPDMEWGEAIHDPRLGGLEVVGDLGPGPNPHPVGLRDPAVLEQRPRRRLLVGPHALLQGTPELGMVGLAHEVVALVIEGGIEEESIVLDLEVLVLLADASLPQGDELLALGKGTHRDGPLFEGNRHRRIRFG